MRIHVNGRQREVPADGTTPLLYALRNDLGLVGTRFGCGLGQCGACTVLIDGRPAMSCTTPLESVVDLRVTTIEGLNDSVARSVLDAIECEQAAQCGFCLPGIAVTLVSLLHSQPDLDRDAVCNWLRGHLCRCGSHGRIVKAALRAAESLNRV